MSAIILHCMSIVHPPHSILLGHWITLVPLRVVAAHTFTLTDYGLFIWIYFMNLSFVLPCYVKISLYFAMHFTPDPCRYNTVQVRIQGLVKGGTQLLRLKVANIAKWSHASKASNLQLGSRAHLRALEAFGFLMLKYAFSCIL